GRPGAAQRHRPRPGHSRGRPQARHRALRAAGGEPYAAWFRPRPEPRQCGRNAAWRGAPPRRRPSRPGSDTGASRSLPRAACGPNAGCATEGGMNASAPGNAERHPLAARFVAGPYVSAPDKAEQRLGDWLCELEPAQSAALDSLLGHANAKKILLGICEFSPYLFDLVRADAARLTRILACDPESHVSSLIEDTARAVWSAPGETEVTHLLRRMKAEAALLIALCDIGGVWPVMQVTAALTDLAVASVQMALRNVLRQEAARGRLSPANAEHPEESSGLFVLAMGKMGAGGLKYSSDIDLIGFFDP